MLVISPALDEKSLSEGAAPAAAPAAPAGPALGDGEKSFFAD